MFRLRPRMLKGLIEEGRYKDTYSVCTSRYQSISWYFSLAVDATLDNSIA